MKDKSNDFYKPEDSNSEILKYRWYLQGPESKILNSTRKESEKNITPDQDGSYSIIPKPKDNVTKDKELHNLDSE
jgi:hypothetical protein